MRSLDVPGGRFDRVLDVLMRAGQILTASTDVVDTLTQVAALCVPDLGDYCSIRVVLDALERDEFSVSAGVHSERPLDERQSVVEQLTAGRRHLGTIVCQTLDEEGYGETARRTLKLLAVQLAIVLFGYVTALREHRVADRFQRALLPERLPEVPGVTFHAAYRPASDEAEVGGDWYDAFDLGDGRLAISVGDVAGHGLDAAVIMGEVRQAIRTAAVGAATPSAVLEYVNGVLRLRESIGMVTAFYGVYDAAESSLSYAVAGHPAPLLSLPNGFTRPLPSGGIPLGCDATLSCSNWTFSIPQGARAVFYTDGLIENERNVIAGEEALIEAVRSLCTEPAADPAAAIAERIFRGRANRDDAAILVLERTAPVAQYVFSAVAVVSPMARSIVQSLIEELPFSGERQFGVLVAVGEAIANAVEHGYRGMEPGIIRLRVDVENGQLLVTVEDFGRWRPFVRREERGRGIELMHAFMDGVQIKSTRGSTAIVLRAQLAGAANGAVSGESDPS